MGRRREAPEGLMIRHETSVQKGEQAPQAPALRETADAGSPFGGSLNGKDD